ncbi:DNA kinase/phosphatase Pnk1 [Schizosaccharomyces japonicus yFS275]|uniref:DNA kinase/phosphatase Pnk1 n=1 Tax=Schizosaccharomyces japonicus (strain yFS275 / FY16936) TaxID=402676 RepID=B6K0W2_SCHJY|nr:DNA kinase/phosphatase Pnk1 [Schizosaccharomyces japonicus yFS275]EEB07583.1 DNA kinase/phosphatase Pnk1 [Schizosaccharomyces japonicus yFS275]
MGNSDKQTSENKRKRKPSTSGNEKNCPKEIVNDAAGVKKTRGQSTLSHFVKSSQSSPAITNKPLAWELYPSLYVGRSPCFSPTDRIIAFDLDGTLIRPKSGRTFPKDENDWVWLYGDIVPKRLREEHASGASIVIFTNQNGIPRRPATAPLFRRKIELLTQALDIPILVYAAIQKDKYRKPLTGMWEEMKNVWLSKIDKSQACYVGDAAGRSADHASTDWKFAENIGIQFYTPEQFFLHKETEPPNAGPFQPKDFLQTKCSNNKETDFQPLDKQEVVVFVGLPSCGKSTFFETQIASHSNYIVVNQDTLKTKARCLKFAREQLEQGHSIVVDATNPDEKTRKDWILLAKEKHLPIRCVLFTTPESVAKHNNVFRAIHERKTKLLPDVAFASYKSRYQEPTVKEGFQSITPVSFTCLPEKADKWVQWQL